MLETTTKGFLFDIKHYAIHDGPGIRTTVFLKGCPARCLWCANPESQKFSCEIACLDSECVACGLCLEACPEKAISLLDGRRIFNRKACVACGKCVAACPEGALELMGREVTVGDLYREISPDRPFWERSGGGVTLSGGEPLAQASFAREFLQTCKEHYIHTALETCLYAPEEALRSMAPYVDYFMCDLKIMDHAKHTYYTEVSNEIIKKNLAFLLQDSFDVLVRMPLIPEVNDDRENLIRFADFLNANRPNAKVELLPYHKLGESKYPRLSRKYEMRNTLPPSEEAMAKTQDFLKNLGITIVTS